MLITSFIDVLSSWMILSLIIICSPVIKVPVVCDNAISFKPVAPAFQARYPIAPLAKTSYFCSCTGY